MPNILQNIGDVLKLGKTVRNRMENRLDAKLKRSKEVNATNNVNEVDRRNEPDIRTRKTHRLKIIPITTIHDVNMAKCVDDK